MFEITRPSAIRPHSASACSPLAAISSGMSGRMAWYSSLTLCAEKIPPGIVHFFAPQHGAHDRDRIAHRRERTIGMQAHALGCRRDARADAQARPTPRELVERADLHGDQRGMPVVGIEHADADAHLAGRRRARRRRRQRASIEWVLGEPCASKAVRLRGLGEIDAAARVDAAVQTDAELGQIEHVHPSVLVVPAKAGIHIPEPVIMGSRLRGNDSKENPRLFKTWVHTPPGRGPALASEKCACTTRQSPSSLRKTMVERVMNSSPP